MRIERKMESRLKRFAAALVVMAIVVPAWGDSIDDAEAKKRGVAVEVVQLERAQARIAALEIQVAALQRQLAAGTQPKPATQTAGMRGVAAGNEMVLDMGDKVTLKLVPIPAGKFLMGTPPGSAVQNEVQHEVTISKPFYMGVTHVTVDQFAAFVKDCGFKTDAEKEGNSPGFEIKDATLDYKRLPGCSWRKPSFEQKGDHPVVQVSWYDAQAFCGWLSKRSGKTVTLPTEAQWEYACRAGTKTVYPWGDNPNDGGGWANCADQSLVKKMPPNAPPSQFFFWNDGFVFTSPVGSFKVNTFGLYDMIGNALQWCQDCYADYDKASVTDPTGPVTGNVRVLRGGSWGFPPAGCRSAFRGMRAPGDRSYDVGFRVLTVAVD